MRHFAYLVPLLAGLTLACGCSDDGTKNGSQLPTTFGDCASPPCEVALEAFTNNPGTIPYCTSTKDASICPARQQPAPIRVPAGTIGPCATSTDSLETSTSASMMPAPAYWSVPNGPRTTTPRSLPASSSQRAANSRPCATWVRLRCSPSPMSRVRCSCNGHTGDRG
jgi:hypothetical protein